MSDKKIEMAAVIPIGKYKGQPLEVLEADPNYKEWLLGQSWFRDKFTNIHTLIINNFAEPSETPDHNFLQAKFLDWDWVLKWLCGESYEQFKFKEKKQINFEHDGFDIVLRFSSVKISELEQNKLLFAEGITRLKNKDVTVISGFWDTFKGISFRGSDCDSIERIERHGIRSDGDFRFLLDKVLEYQEVYKEIFNEHIVGIEIKPSLGDDYPAILRKIKSNPNRGRTNKEILAYRDFAAQGISEENLIKLFKNENITARRL